MPERFRELLTNCGLYYKPMTIVNDDSRVINKLEASLTDDSRVIIYDRHMFIVQATGKNLLVHEKLEMTRVH
jgi:hypothetical protein